MANTWDETKCGDDDVPGRDFEQTVPWCAFLAIESYLLKDDILVKVNAIETVGKKKEEYQESECGQLRRRVNVRDIEKEPTHARPYKYFCMFPL